MIVLDDLHTRLSRTHAVKRRPPRQFIERYIGANDMVAVVNTGRHGKAHAGVHQQPRAAAARRSTTSWAKRCGRRPRQRSTGLPRSQPRQPRQHRRPDRRPRNDMERGNNARNSMRTLQEPRRLHGRDPRPPQGRRLLQRRHRLRRHQSVQQPDATDVQREDARRHRRGDARQRQHLQRRSARRSPPGWTTRSRSAAFPATTARSADAVLQDELRLAQDSLRVLSEETGGFAVVNQNDFRNALLADPRGQQQLLRARLLPDQREARRPVPQHPGQGDKPGLEGPRAPRLRGAAAGEEGQPAQGGRRESRRRPSCATRSTARCRSAASRSAPSPRRSRAPAPTSPSRSRSKSTAARSKFAQNAEGPVRQRPRGRALRRRPEGKIKDGDARRRQLRAQAGDRTTLVRQRRVRVVRTASSCRRASTSFASARGKAGGGKVGTVIYDLDAPDFTKGTR